MDVAAPRAAEAVARTLTQQAVAVVLPTGLWLARLYQLLMRRPSRNGVLMWQDCRRSPLAVAPSLHEGAACHQMSRCSPLSPWCHMRRPPCTSLPLFLS